jgi:hypothetical protein
LIAAQAKQVLESGGFSTFLAHEDLEVSDEWRECLLLELRRCRLFVPLLSQSYVASVWAMQESGFIASRLDEVVIAPLSIDGTRSNGFLSHVQSPSIGVDGVTRELLVEQLKSRFPRTILPEAIARAIRAGDFRSAERLMRPLVRFFPLLTAEEAEALALGAIENGQIWDAALCRNEYLPEFLQAVGTKLQPRTLRALTHQIENGQWYNGD